MTNTAQKPTNVAEQINLAELLDDSVVGDVTVRFICTLKKILNNYDGQLTDAQIELEMDIARVYFDIGNERRSEAFTKGRSDEQRLPNAFNNRLHKSEERLTPVVLELAPKPEPQPNYAPAFTAIRASSLLKTALDNIGSGKAVTFSQIKTAVGVLHLAPGEEWREEDLKVQSNNLKAWEMRLQNELVKLRKQDVISYRQTKGDYFIF